jgi:hypothetical protein
VPAEAPFDASAALARVPLFTRLSPDALADVAGRLAALELAPGDSIKEGGGRLSLIRSGRAQVRLPGLGGAAEPVAELGSGDFFGLGAMFGQERGTELVASERTRLLVLDDESIAGLAGAYPSIAAALEGTRAPAAAPVGGARLSRLTIGPGASLAPVGAPAAPAPPDTADIRRTTGAIPRVG